MELRTHQAQRAKRSRRSVHQKLVAHEATCSLDGNTAGVLVTAYPLRASTALRFESPEPAPVSLRVFDVSGRVVRTLVGAEKGRATSALGGRAVRTLRRSIRPHVGGRTRTSWAKGRRR